MTHFSQMITKPYDKPVNDVVMESVTIEKRGR